MEATEIIISLDVLFMFGTHKKEHFMGNLITLTPAVAGVMSDLQRETFGQILTS